MHSFWRSASGSTKSAASELTCQPTSSAVDARAAALRVLEALEHVQAAAFGDHDAVAVAVEGARGLASGRAWLASAPWARKLAKMPKVWMLSETPPPMAWSISPSCSICAPWISPRLPAAQAAPMQ